MRFGTLILLGVVTATFGGHQEARAARGSDNGGNWVAQQFSLAGQFVPPILELPNNIGFDSEADRLAVERLSRSKFPVIAMSPGDLPPNRYVDSDHKPVKVANNKFLDGRGEPVDSLVAFDSTQQCYTVILNTETFYDLFVNHRPVMHLVIHEIWRLAFFSSVASRNDEDYSISSAMSVPAALEFQSSEAPPDDNHPPKDVQSDAANYSAQLALEADAISTYLALAGLPNIEQPNAQDGYGVVLDIIVGLLQRHQDIYRKISAAIVALKQANPGSQIPDPPPSPTTPALFDGTTVAELTDSKNGVVNSLRLAASKELAAAQAAASLVPRFTDITNASLTGLVGNTSAAQFGILRAMLLMVTQDTRDTGLTTKTVLSASTIDQMSATAPQ